MKLHELIPTNSISNETILPEILESALFESRGLAARAPGEVFKSKSDDSEIYFRTIKFWPEEGGKMDKESLQPTIDAVQKTMNNVQIGWVNNASAQTGGFGIALFDTQDGEIVAYGRYFNDIKSNPVSNSWDNKTGVPGYEYASNAAQKTSSGMTPQDVLTLDQTDLTADEIIYQISRKIGEFHPLTKLSNDIAAGAPLPISFDGTGISFTAFRDYFCELLHPIALQVGTYSGNAAEAAEIYLGGKGYDDCLISFGLTKTEGLSDSIMISGEGKKIKVSSKGAKGATASVKNLVDAANEAAEQGNTKLLTKHKDILDMIRDVQKAGQRGAPLMLGQKFGIIKMKDVEDINSFHNKKPTTMAILLADKNLSPRLKKLAQERVTRDPQNLNAYFHLIAAVAHKVAAHVNSSGEFSSAASEILNNSALVQVYTTAKQVGNNFTLVDFNTKFPGSQVTNVLLKASKGYSSTEIKGNFTFEILRNNAKDSDPEDDGTTATGTFQ